MKELPILFSTAMVQAKLAGRKTMTRRLKGLENINNNPSDWEFDRFEDNAKGGLNAVFKHRNGLLHESIPCPYGRPGDLLWVRETFREYYYVDKYGYTHFDKEIIEYAADNPPAIYLVDGDGAHMLNKDGTEKFVPWRPNIFMPKAIARIWLQITDIRVERLHDISEEDAVAEGVEINRDGSWHDYLEPARLCQDSAKASFQSLWIKINGDESWETNPFAWVVSFTVLSTTGRPTEEIELLINQSQQV